ncbi:MAG TPA: PadR family transcriptional regulator [Acidimicrobiales bacterium]|nr:PadR family transcriptional regulator [Acidimicrobiales bacterium]
MSRGVGEPAGAGFEAGGFPPGFGHGHWHGGPPPWRGGRRARRGDIRWALLVGLLDGPAHGYELIGRLESRTGGLWRPSAGSVYPTLQLLEEEGLITGRDEEGKRVYELTEEGRTAAREASERIGRGPWAREGSEHQLGLRQAGKTLMLAVRQVAAAGNDDQVTAATTVLTEARQRVYRILAGDPPTEGGTPPGGPDD